MNNILNLLTRFGDKLGSPGALVSTMSCAMCFPAIASLGSAIGLGFLQDYEGLFLNTIIPIVVWFSLVINALGWFAHHQWYRTLLGITGPSFYLLAFYPWFKYGWSTYVTYGSLALMVAVSIWDMIWPANKRCEEKCH